MKPLVYNRFGFDWTVEMAVDWQGGSRIPGRSSAPRRARCVAGRRCGRAWPAATGGRRGTSCPWGAGRGFGALPWRTLRARRAPRPGAGRPAPPRRPDAPAARAAARPPASATSPTALEDHWPGRHLFHEKTQSRRKFWQNPNIFHENTNPSTTSRMGPRTHQPFVTSIQLNIPLKDRFHSQVSIGLQSERKRW